MADRPFRFLPILGLSIALICSVSTFAQEKPAPDGPKPEAAPPAPAPKPAEHEMLLKDAKRVEGLIPLYRTETKLFAELSGNHYADEYLVLISIARGIGQGMLLGGMTWGFGDEWVWQFRKVDKNVHVIRRNIRFKAEKGTPESTAVRNAYTDSVLFSLPIATKGPNGGDLVELSQIFMSDLPQISNYLPGFMFAANRSTYDSVKGFKDNVELQVAATYASGGQVNFDTVPDSRGVTITVHYSISKIPSTGYKPRVADDRVGYFLTVVKDFSKKDAEDQFVRFINRWHLQKADPSLERSPPKEHLVFYIEKTVPFKYRQPIREGILEWNKAFAKAGFDNAIEVKQQTDEDDWDPEDINYNTFRWITSNAGFAMGPSRVNPYTGQILDADVILDADFVTYWKHEFETLTAKSIAMTGGIQTQLPGESPFTRSEFFSAGSPYRHCLLSQGMARQMAFGATAILAEPDPKKSAELEEKLIMQGLKEVTMHEVGHTLGLRHNFKGSTLLALKDVNDVAKTRDGGMVASVMDYNPANIVPNGATQGDYYPTTIGPYDYWAIEYGYKHFSGNEEEELKKVAARSGEPALKYATDEDTRGIVDPDPEANRFDLGADSLEFAKQRAQLMKELIPGLLDKAVKDGEDYTKARRAFNVVLSHFGESMYFASRYVGGLHTSRSHKGDKDGKPPFAVVDVNKQRESLKLLEENVFSDKPFDFPPALYNHLASTNWSHWGVREPRRKDMAVHELILMWQEQIIEQLLSPVTLERIHDTEMKVPADQDALTAAELLDRLSKAVFAELRSTPEGGNFTERKPAISSLRRNLQRSYFKTVANIALGRTGAPQDCQTVAYAQLAGLKEEIDKLLASKAKLDAYTSAHLKETSSRIDRVLKADFNVGTP